MKMKLILIFFLLFVGSSLFLDVNSIFAYAECGTYQGVSFQYYTSKRHDPSRGSGYLYEEKTKWPSTEESNFCGEGSAQPTVPSFPGAGQDTQWECVGEFRTVSCFAHKAPYPSFMPPNEMSTCLNIGGYCGSLHGRLFPHDQTEWPSDGYACAYSPGNHSSQHLLFYPDGRVPPFNWGKRLMPTDTGSGGRGGYRNQYTHGAFLSKVLNNPTYDFHTQPSDFPEMGERIEWRCTRTWGWYTYGMRIHDRDYYVNCWAKRRQYPPPDCGTLHERQFEATKTDWPVGEDDTFCVNSNAQPIPTYPRAGRTVTWECVSPSDLFAPVPCRAERLLPTPWLSTRGGFFHTEGGIDLEMQSTLYSKMPDQAPEPLVEEEGTSLSTELLTLNSGNLSSVGWSDEIYTLLNYSKRINTSWYEVLLGRAKARDALGHLWTEVEEEDIDSDLDLDLCKNDRQIYFINGSLDVNPLDYEDLGIEDINGCIFVVKNDVIINEGEYKSEGMDPDDFYSSPGYDLVRGFFLVDGVIDIPFADDGKDLRDGLKVVGGLFATGGPSSISLDRSLYIHNHKFPSLIVFHDVRYINLAREVFGHTQNIRDIGFKE